MNINDFTSDLMDIGLYSAVIDAKTTSDAWRDWSMHPIWMTHKKPSQFFTVNIQIYTLIVFPKKKLDQDTIIVNVGSPKDLNRPSSVKINYL